MLIRLNFKLFLLIFLAVINTGRASGQAGPESIIISPRLSENVITRNTFIPYRELDRPGVGLALSGGGARCLSQIGVLQVLETAGIPIDVIVGTSMGSIIGGLYAAGYSANELEDIAKSIKWNTILVDKPPRRSLFFGQKQERDRFLLKIRLDGLKPHIPPALTPGQRLQSILTDLVMNSLYASTTDFDHFRIPFRAICTDLYSGEKIVLSSGDLPEVMRASLAFPLLFTPVPLNGRLLVDGGMVDNIPVSEVAKFPVDLVIAVDSSSPLRNANQLNAPWEIADQATSIMQRDRNRLSRQRADVLIQIHDSTRTSMDFANIDSIIALGRKEALAQLPQIRKRMQELKISRIERELMQRSFKVLREMPANGHEPSPSSEIWKEPHIFSYFQILQNVEALYRRADVRSARAVLTPAGDGYALSYQVVRNPVLKGVAFRGNTVFPDDSLQQFFLEQLGKPINPRETKKALAALIRHYRDHGYALARIVQLRFDAGSGTGVVYLGEGRIEKITLEGNERTKPFVILREFPLEPGAIFNYKQAQKGLENIFGTGLFDRVSLSLARTAAGSNLRLKLEEKKYNVLGISARADFERKTRGLIEFSDENFQGIGAKLVLHGLYGSRDQAYRMKFSSERIFKTYLTFTAEAYIQMHRNNVYFPNTGEIMGIYRERWFGASFQAGQLVRRFGIVTAAFHTDLIQLDGLAGTGFPTGKTVVNRLTFRSILDTRDRLPYPMRGRYVLFNYDMSIRTLESDDSFFRFYGTAETFNTFYKRHTFNPRFKFGTSDLTTPFIFHYKLSGPDDFLGLHDQEWTGRFFFLFNFTYRYFIPSKLQVRTNLGLRFDVGGIWQNAEDANYRRIRRAIGAFVGMETPLGTVELSYGRLDRAHQRFYLSWGYNF